MVITFKDQDERKLIARFVELVAEVYEKSSVATIDAVSRALQKPELNIGFQETDDLDTNQFVCFKSMIKILDSIGAEEVNAANDIRNRYPGEFQVSDIPRFREMLNKNGIDPKYCDDLFVYWCSNEGLGAIAIACLDIQANQHHVDMTDVYTWCEANEPTAGLDWRKERDLWYQKVHQ